MQILLILCLLLLLLLFLFVYLFAWLGFLLVGWLGFFSAIQLRDHMDYAECQQTKFEQIHSNHSTLRSILTHFTIKIFIRQQTTTT